jgi:glycosyltransferase involved in cell wall biosynthesis
MRLMPTVRLGVVIPTYNRSDALLESLAHLETQTCKDFEVVVVDDGSTDSTQSVMESYLRKTPLAIRYARQNNRGPAAARNLAISMLQAPVCLMIGDDIFASPTLVERHIALHQEQPELQVAGLGWTQWSKSGQTITPVMKWLGESPEQFAYKDLLAGVEPNSHHFYSSNLSVKTELLRKFPFCEDFPYAAMEDCELGYRIQKLHGLKIRFLPDAIAYHLHPTTFRQLCERRVRVGYSARLFHELWPEQRLTPATPLRRAYDLTIRTIAQSSLLTKLLVDAADISSRVLCPNRLMLAASLCKYDVGYESERDSQGKLVRR